MLNVALTGNIASGKSTVLEWFAEWGATVIDADELVREAQGPGSETLAAIARRFGDQMLRPDGSLDRAALRRAVMDADDARQSLNAIVHPVVRRRRTELVEAAAARGDCVVVSDIPLLFEVLKPSEFDLVVLIDAPAALRRERLVTLRGLDGNEADRLIAAQLPAAEKRPRSNIVIDNAGSRDQTRKAAWTAWRDIRSQAATIAAGRGGPLVAVFAHARDVIALCGGTLARYRDAGMETHLLSARNAGAAAAADLLGVTRFTALSESEEHHRSEIAAAIRNASPGVMITFGPEGLNGHSDHLAVHRSTRSAWSEAGAPCPLYYVAAKKFSAQLDVRPWQDVKRDAVTALQPTGEAADCNVPLSVDRECYTAEHPPARVLFDLYEKAEHAVDSPRTAR